MSCDAPRKAPVKQAMESESADVAAALANAATGSSAWPTAQYTAVASAASSRSSAARYSSPLLVDDVDTMPQSAVWSTTPARTGQHAGSHRPPLTR
jgi:hypothetical protein